MIRITSENQILDSFRTDDRDEVRLPSGLKFPYAMKDYMTWVEPSGHRVFLVFPDDVSGNLRGVVFQRTPGGSDVPASMCQWCHSVRGGNGVSLLTTSAGRQRRVGVHLCSSLNCRENALSPPGVNDFQEGLSGHERVQRILQRMREFALRNLF